MLFPANSQIGVINRSGPKEQCSCLTSQLLRKAELKTLYSLNLQISYSQELLWLQNFQGTSLETPGSEMHSHSILILRPLHCFVCLIIHESDKNLKPGLSETNLQFRISLCDLAQLSHSLQAPWRLDSFGKKVQLLTLWGTRRFNMKLSKSKLPSPREDPSNGSYD